MQGGDWKEALLGEWISGGRAAFPEVLLQEKQQELLLVLPVAPAQSRVWLLRLTSTWARDREAGRSCCLCVSLL